MPLEKKEGLFGGITPLIYYWKKRRELFIEETNNDVRVLFSDSKLSKKKKQKVWSRCKIIIKAQL